MTEIVKPRDPLRMSADVAAFLGASPCPIGVAGYPQVNFADELFVWTWDGQKWRWPIADRPRP